MDRDSDNMQVQNDQKKTNEQYVMDSVNGNPIIIETDKINVKQRLGLWDGVVFIVGGIIGSGIFISPKGALKFSGSIGMSLVIWTISGIMSFILALVYADLGTQMPRSGGDYTYIRTVIGSVPGFLVAWLQTIFSQAGGRAVLALVFADYLCAPIFGPCGAPNSIRKTIAAVKILTLGVTNTISVRFVASVQGFFTVFKTLALVVITVGGLVYFVQGRVENFADSFEGSTTDVTSISLAIYSCMWAYSGYNILNDMAEEIINPRRNIPKAIFISLTLVIVIYLTTNVSYFVMLSKDEFLSVSAVAYAWGDKVLGPGAIFIPISVMCSVYGAANGGIFSDVRVRFAGARAGHLPEVLSFLHHKSRIPLVSLWFNVICALIMLIPGDIGELINMTSFLGFAVIFLTMMAYFRMRYLRRNKPKDKTTFRLPIVIPIAACLISVFMLVSPFINNPRIEFIYGASFVVGGLLFYLPFVYFELKVPGFDHVTTFLQLLLDICPTVIPEDDEI